MGEQTRAGAEFDYIVVGSGAGGGPLAANLARGGYRVLLLEAGGDDEDHTYRVPAFHGLASEDPAMRWDFFVKHYQDPALRRRDTKYTPEHDGVLYPRAGTLGGCTAHNAMITIKPHDSDWDAIADATGDESWRSERMHAYFERLERCGYVNPVQRFVERVQHRLGLLPTPNPSGHGYRGWLPTSRVDPRVALPDRRLIRLLLRAVRTAVGEGTEHSIARIFGVTAHFDPNDRRVAAQSPEGLCFAPMATRGGRRAGPRDLIREVQREHPDRLVVRTHCLATRVLLDDGHTAVGVEYRQGERLYRADRDADPAAQPEAPTRTARALREVVLAGGAYNTPQLLMLSGIGPAPELARHGIPVRVDLPGVGRNLQDRYEVGVVAEMRDDFALLEDATFLPPEPGQEPDGAFVEWQAGRGVYTSNGVVLGVVRRSGAGQPDPDLFVFGIPGFFKGYFPGYSRELVRKKNFFTWAVLKAHTRNTAGHVTLRSSDPRDVPEIVFRYFDEGNDARGEDLEAVVEGVLFARRILRAAGKLVKRELVPGPAVDDREQLREFIRREAWGHHASCTSKMGPREDPMAVVDSQFRVHGTQGLRVVDASVFPRIPGFFIVAAIYMISEKASEVMLADAARRPRLGVPVASPPATPARS